MGVRFGVGDSVTEQFRKAHLRANELGSRFIAVLLEPIGEHETRRVFVRVIAYGT